MYHFFVVATNLFNLIRVNRVINLIMSNLIEMRFESKIFLIELMGKLKVNGMLTRREYLTENLTDNHKSKVKLGNLY